MGTSGMSPEELKALRDRKKKIKQAVRKRQRDEAEDEEAGGPTGDSMKDRKAARKFKKETEAAAAKEEEGEEGEVGEEEVEEEEEAPPQHIQVQVDGILSDKNFDSLELSKPTMAGIAEMGHSVMTEVQARTIPPLLAGRDVLGAARTGSGKLSNFADPQPLDPEP